MKILITSGGTTEAIDCVRGITNQATGNLGKIVAETFLAAGHEVSLVTTKTAVKPEQTPKLNIHLITDVASLMVCLKELVPQHDVLIHSMAVSDYTPVYMAGLDEVLATDREKLLTMTNQESKISSNEDYQLLLLKKTPKVISYIKTWNPQIRLVGFKLLVDVPKEELLAVARASLVKNQADYILANDLSQIGEGKHRAYLVDKETETQVETKEAIAQLLLERLT